ncbi:hypothetical protein Gotur_004306 [Gossypium turneri]
MVRQPILSSNITSQSPWSQDPNSAFQARIDLMSKAQYLLNQEIYKLWTDGR